MVVQANLRWNGQLKPLNPANVKYIVLHHAEAMTASPEDIHQWHLDNGWVGAGYNEYIRKDGTVYIMRGDNVGAHCLGYNETGYGICCEGNYERETKMPDAQYKALVERVLYNKSRFNAKVLGHKDLVATLCPGKYFPLQEMYTLSEGGNNMLLKQGDNNAAVSMLQQKLNKLGYNLAVDGDFGPATRAAVVDFQQKNGLAADGIAGPLTFDKLEQAIKEIEKPKPEETVEYWKNKYNALVAKIQAVIQG